MRTRFTLQPCAARRIAACRAVPALALGGLLLATGCQSHSAAWDDNWSQCEASAIEQAEYADVDQDQRTTWRERYIGSCMQSRGFHDPQYLFGGQQGGRN